ncbi:hypothetical protein [Paraburkholderia phosphatilytica]|uniref:hypothetical protein n=1 Tax=Paraburkholderia phosphatilytica TaxID=2282883 RepID=UPI000E4CA5F9|nr:hypothetical protein [Paraburkholderia phosphatilytica]
MPTATRSDSLDWPLISTAVTVALLIRLSIANGAFEIVPFLWVAMAVVALWLVVRMIAAVKRRELLGFTSAVVAAIFIYTPWMAVMPWIDSTDTLFASAPRIDRDPIEYRLRVASFKMADPKRTFIVFKPTDRDESDGVESRVAYDETDTLARGKTDQVIALARSQSPQDVAEFSACGWHARRVEGHYYVVEFSC